MEEKEIPGDTECGSLWPAWDCENVQTACKTSEGDPNPGKALEKQRTCRLGPELRVTVMGTEAGSKWEIAKKGEKAVCSPS